FNLGELLLGRLDRWGDPRVDVLDELGQRRRKQPALQLFKQQRVLDFWENRHSPKSFVAIGFALSDEEAAYSCRGKSPTQDPRGRHIIAARYEGAITGAVIHRTVAVVGSESVTVKTTESCRNSPPSP